MQGRLLHRRHHEAAIGTEADAEMRALPFEEFRLGGGVGKPERHAIVMRDRETEALRREGETRDCRWRFERARLTLAGNDARDLAGRPCDSAVGAQRYLVDPALPVVGR